MNREANREANSDAVDPAGGARPRSDAEGSWSGATLTPTQAPTQAPTLAPTGVNGPLPQTTVVHRAQPSENPEEIQRIQVDEEDRLAFRVGVNLLTLTLIAVGIWLLIRLLRG